MEHGTGAEGFPKNAREYVPVGLGRAIHGVPRFWEALLHTLSDSIDIASKKMIRLVFLRYR